MNPVVSNEKKKKFAFFAFKVLHLLLAVLVFMLAAGCFGWSNFLTGRSQIQQVPTTGHNDREESFYYFQGEKMPVTIYLDRVGIVSREAIDIESFSKLMLGKNLEVKQHYQNRLFILDLKKISTRKEIFSIALALKRTLKEKVKEAGMVVLTSEGGDPSIISEEFIVGFKNPEISLEQIKSFNKKNNVSIVKKNPFVKGQYLLKVLEDSEDALSTANRYAEDPMISYAYPNFSGVDREQETVPSDPLFGDQWHLRNIGVGQADADADLSMAWDITMGSANTVIAVFELGGFDMGHPDLTPNFWVNPGEDLNSNGVIDVAEMNGIDNDGNGLTDDFYGWDFWSNDNNPIAEAGEDHGTAVAGVVAARDGNSIGVSGSCPRCRLMLLRIPYGNDFTKSLAYSYAHQMGVRIFTNSWSSTAAYPNTITAINNAAAGGTVVIFSAGNNNNLNVCTGSNATTFPPLADVFSVSSSTNLDRKAIGGFFVGSAIGNCVDLLAPSFHGDAGTMSITTTDRTGNAGYNNTTAICATGITEPADLNYTGCFGGTSAAAPLTAGVAGLILTADNTLTRIQVQQLLQDTADKIEPAVGAYSDINGFSSPASGVATHSWGRLNAFEAVRIAASTASGGKNGVDVFLRDNRLDWGNTEQPSYTVFDSPRGFIPFWVSMDIKVDAPPYQAIPSTSLAFDSLVDKTPSAVTGDINRVYVRVRNRGPNTANPVTVKLLWTQFGTGLPALPSDFWTQFPGDSLMTSDWTPMNCAGGGGTTCTVSNLGYSGSSVAGTAADAAQIVQFDFPAPAVDPSKPNHFCLLAMTDTPNDRILPKSRPTIPDDFIIDALTPRDNNVSHRNYYNLPTGTSGSSNSFLVRNPYNTKIDIALRLKNPREWQVSLDKFKFNETLTLQPKEEILVKVSVKFPQLKKSGEITIIQERVDVTPAVVMGGITLGLKADDQAGVSTTFPPCGGQLTPYLIGNYDLRKARETHVSIVNPTGKSLRVKIALLDDNEKFLYCLGTKLSPNDLFEFPVSRYVKRGQYGVIKVVALNEVQDVPETGVIGVVRKTYRRWFLFFSLRREQTETLLQPIPYEILKDDLPLIWGGCKEVHWQ
jgi:hypothetical protein